ncbi:MAG: hypothetical protein QN144_14640 [Armatimonadota bacterium]|nr:hypothetical protein [Armatimonadota bacterium]
MCRPGLFRWAVCAAVFAALSGPCRPLHAQPGSTAVCPGGALPVVDGGRSSALGLFGELGVRCGLGDRGSVTFGLRYAESRAGVLPWATLSSSWPAGRATTVTLSVGLRERLGDWEGDRLPEVGLRLSSPDSAPVPGWLEAAAGLFNVYGVHSGVLRGGLRLHLFTRPLQMGQASARLGIAAGYYRYSTGGDHAFLTWTVDFRARLVRDVSFQLAYLQADSSGTSPLRFDAVGPDRYWTAGLEGTAGSATAWRLGLLVDSAGGAGIREYRAAVGLGRNWFSLTYRTADRQLLVGVSLTGWSGR